MTNAIQTRTISGPNSLFRSTIATKLKGNLAPSNMPAFLKSKMPQGILGPKAWSRTEELNRKGRSQI